MFLRPGTLDEALKTLAHTPATILAGGTDLFPAFPGSQLKGPILDISAIAELKGIHTSDDFVHIGARTTWSELLAASLPRGFDGLRAAAREIGSVQIQNQATVAGNICNASPAADGVATLIALDAEVRLASHEGTRTLTVTEFVQGNRKTARKPNEILTSVRIPLRWQNAASCFMKLGARRYLVISIVMVSANLRIGADRQIEEAAICVGSCSAKAVRLKDLENALIGLRVGSRLGQIVSSEYFAPISPIDDIRGSAEYRGEAAQTLVRRALFECASKVA